MQMEQKIKRKTNIQLRKLVSSLLKTKKPSWNKVAKEMLSPRRRKVAVNIYKINKYAKGGETIIVPGKVLSSGVLDKPVFIASYSATGLARKKLGNRLISIGQAVKENPEGKNIRIIK